MIRTYSQLTHDQRLQIEVLRGKNLSSRAIAARLGVSPSTISREIKRGSADASDWYFAVQGQAARSYGRNKVGADRRILGTDVDSPAWRHVLSGLRLGWSPEQVAGRLKFDAIHRPDQPCFTVSHETIYCAIYAMPRGELKTELIKLLRQSRAGRRPRARGVDRTSTALKDMISIDLRPPEVCARIVPGHWEGDLIKGKANRSAVGTLVERTSRYLMLAKLDGADSGSVLNGFTNRLKSIPESLRKTLTYDQGSEMALHKVLSTRLRLDVYFCDAHSPWQRGSNENANGLIREYLPKGTDLSDYSHQALASIEQALNNRPRKILGYRTPTEVFDNIKLHGLQGVALQA
jgi:transposase, IS30 family